MNGPSNMDMHPTLLHGDADARGLGMTFGLSVILHLLLVAVLIFATDYRPRKTFASSVISVNMVSLPESEPTLPAAAADEGSLEPAPPAPASRPEQPPLSAETMEQMLVKQDPPEPEPPPREEIPEAPAPPPEPVEAEPETPEPAPETPGEKVVIDPEPEPEPVQAREEPPEAPPESPEPEEKPAPETAERVAPPRKKPRYAKPSDADKAKVVAPKRAEDAVQEAIENLRTKVAKRGGGRSVGGVTGNGTGAMGQHARMAITSYAGTVIPERINRNWAFSEYLASRRGRLEAILVITIRSDGSISEVWFEKRSGDRYFDDSAYKAVVKSNPLPALPGAYTAYEDTYTVGLRFTPSGIN